MKQTQFAQRRNELIAQYDITVQPAWQEYQARLARSNNKYTRYRARSTFRAEIKPHLELLFARIGELKRQLEANPK